MQGPNRVQVRGAQPLSLVEWGMPPPYSTSREDAQIISVRHDEQGLGAHQRTCSFPPIDQWAIFPIVGSCSAGSVIMQNRGSCGGHHYAKLEELVVQRGSMGIGLVHAGQWGAQVHASARHGVQVVQRDSTLT
jgi:hypothetical protein